MAPRGLLIISIVLAVLVFPCACARALDQLDPILSRNTRLMVFSPHPDDESLGAGGLIQRVLGKGGRVKVVFMTSGDGFTEGIEKARHLSHPAAIEYRKYGNEREKEALKALAVLGLKKNEVIFLGFPDAVLSNLIRKFSSDPGKYTSPFTLINHPPVPEIILRHTDYNGRDVIKEIIWELAHFRPNLVATTPSEGQHPDHCATHYFVEKALAEMGRKDSTSKPRVLDFLIHFKRWPMDTAAGSCVSPPEGFPNKAHEKGTKWVSLPLSPKEIETKRRAILEYHTQMLIMDSYMLSFVRPNELFIMDQESVEEMEEIPWCGEGVLNQIRPSTPDIIVHKQ